MAKLKQDNAQLKEQASVPAILTATEIVDGVDAGPSKTGAVYSDMPRLFTLPAMQGLAYGVLRRHFSDRINNTSDWTLGKLGLNPTGAPLPAASRLSNLRWDVLLPSCAPDILRHPVALCKQYEHEATERQKDLVIHCKLTVAGDQPLHYWWEAARMFASEVLVVEHQLSVIMVLHDPPATGYIAAAGPHIHLMAPARALSARGFRETSLLARDCAHQFLADAWREVRRGRNL